MGHRTAPPLRGTPRRVPPAPRAKRKTPKTHHFDYQNQKFGVDSASLSKTLGINQICFHLTHHPPPMTGGR